MSTAGLFMPKTVAFITLIALTTFIHTLHICIYVYIYIGQQTKAIRENEQNSYLHNNPNNLNNHISTISKRNKGSENSKGSENNNPNNPNNPNNLVKGQVHNTLLDIQYYHTDTEGEGSENESVGSENNEIIEEEEDDEEMEASEIYLTPYLKKAGCIYNSILSLSISLSIYTLSLYIYIKLT